MPPKKNIDIIFVTTGMEKMENNVEDFLFLPKGVCRTAPATPGLLKKGSKFFNFSDTLFDMRSPVHAI